MDISTEVQRRFPEFEPDPAFLDLPYVVLGEFGEFLRKLLRDSTWSTVPADCVAEFLNDVIASGDREATNIVETTVFEIIADDGLAADALRPLLNETARRCFDEVIARFGRA